MSAENGWDHYADALREAGYQVIPPGEAAPRPHLDRLLDDDGQPAVDLGPEVGILVLLDTRDRVSVIGRPDYGWQKTALAMVSAAETMVQQYGGTLLNPGGAQ